MSYSLTETACAETFSVSSVVETSYRGFSGVVSGHRLYSPVLERWLNRDPIGEKGARLIISYKNENIFNKESYIFAGNNPPNIFDYLGMRDIKMDWIEETPECEGRQQLKDDGTWEMRTTTPNKEYKPLTNGCGPQNGIDVPDDFPFGSFTPACNDHDRCYGTCGNAKSQCDANLYWGMIDVCINAQPFSAYCFYVAGIYYLGVHWGGVGAYETSQDEACEWKKCCKKNPHPVGRR